MPPTKCNKQRAKQTHSRGSPTKGNKIRSKIRSGRLTPAFSRAQKRAEMLRHPYILGGPQQRGTKSEVKLEVATSPLPSHGPKKGRKCYITPAFLVVPNKGEQNQKWLPHPCLLGGPKEGGNATSPLHSWGSQTPSAGRKSEVAIWVFWGTLTLTLKKIYKGSFFIFLLHSRDTSPNGGGGPRPPRVMIRNLCQYG